jgi:hypothetical protein
MHRSFRPRKQLVFFDWSVVIELRDLPPILREPSPHFRLPGDPLIANDDLTEYFDHDTPSTIVSSIAHAALFLHSALRISYTYSAQ